MSHVLVTRLDSEGDVLLAGPAIRAVAAGSSRVTLLCGPRGEQAARLLPGVDEVLVWRAPWIDPEPDPVDPADVAALVQRVRALAPDRAVILGSFHQSPLPTALVLRLAAVPHVAAESEDYPGSLLDVRHHAPPGLHEVERSLHLAAALGYALPRGDDGRLRVRRPERIAPPFDAPYVVVHPGASVPARAWAPERNAALVDALAGAGRNVAVTGSPAERALTALVAGPPRERVRDLGGATSLAGLAEVLAGAEAVAVGNTGPAHLAAAVGTPVISLFAPTVPAERWRPWRVPHELLHLDVPCAGCRARVCPVEGHPCIDEVTPDDVLAALARVAPERVEVAA
jgi:ADP-heptose:LPS heptosyltransferase